MATIKEILDQFCARLNIPKQTTYVGNTAPAALQYLSLFKFIGDELRNRPDNWPQLKRGYYFNTTLNERRYQLPGDFYRLLMSTQWDTTNHWPMIGPISDANYAMREFAIVQSSTLKVYNLIGPTGYLYSTSPYNKRSAGKIEIDPPGQNNTDELFLGYISSNWIWPREWVANTAYSLGNIRTGDGRVYRVITAGTSGTTRPSVTTGTVIDGTVTWEVYTEPYLIESANTQLNDNDLCLFDDDLMIEGVRWAWYRAKKQGYEQERTDWENQVKGAVARFNGPVKVNMCADTYWNDQFPRTPEGSWSV